MIQTLFNIIQILCALVLIVIVMSQTTKNEGLGASIGGKPTTTFRGKAGFEEKLQMYTMYAAVAFFISSIAVAYLPGK
ncbi:MAG: preprotein translocase subunit SecG [Armatimonadota bacterium]